MVTLFPELLDAFAAHGIPRKAVQQCALSLRAVNPRDFTDDPHRTVDDRPYGGGPGMVMRVEPLRKAIAAAHQWVAFEAAFEAQAGPDADLKAGSDALTVYLSPQGRVYNQSMARQLAGRLNDRSNEEAGGQPAFAAEPQPNLSSTTALVLVAGRYEGIDERLLASDIDCEWSVGDFVLSGGELAALSVIDSIARLLPDVLGNNESADNDSFGEDGLLDCPHYTRPHELDGEPVPDVLLSGDHAAIAKWRRREALHRTARRRPDLIKAAMDRAILNKQDLDSLRELGFDMQSVESGKP